MNKHIRALAWWHLIFNGLCLLVGIVLCAALIAEGGGDWKENQALLFVGWFFLGLSVFYFVPGFLGGWGLLKQRGWARALIIIESVLYLPLFPIGTVLGGYSLWVLFSRATNVDFSRQEPGPPVSHSWIPAALRAPETPSARRNKLLFAMALVGSGFVVMIGTGYRISGDAGSPISPPLYYAAIVVLAGALSIVAREIQAGRWPVREEQVVEGGQIHYSRLPVDPVSQPLVSAQDPSGLVTCPHLQPVESGMLSEGILMGRITRLQVRAYCVIEEARFRLRYPNFQPAPVIACDRCHSVIEAVHPDAAVPETPLFPRT